jgi:PleD family two-component response regulator
MRRAHAFGRLRTSSSPQQFVARILARQQSSRAAGKGDDAQALTVLIVDDHRDTVEMFAEYLTADGATAVGAGSAKTASVRYRAAWAKASSGCGLEPAQTHAPRP